MGITWYHQCNIMFITAKQYALHTPKKEETMSIIEQPLNATPPPTYPRISPANKISVVKELQALLGKKYVLYTPYRICTCRRITFQESCRWVNVGQITIQEAVSAS